MFPVYGRNQSAFTERNVSRFERGELFKEFLSSLRKTYVLRKSMRKQKEKSCLLSAMNKTFI